MPGLGLILIDEEISQGFGPQPCAAAALGKNHYTCTLTLSSVLSSTFRLLSEDVTSGPKSTLPVRAEGTAIRNSTEAFSYSLLTSVNGLLSSPVSPTSTALLWESPEAGVIPFVKMKRITALTALDSEGVIHQTLVNHLGAKCCHKVHV